MDPKQILLVIVLNIVITSFLIFTLTPMALEPTNRSGGTPFRDYIPTSEEAGVINLVEEVNPAVLSIIVSQDVPVIGRHFERFGPFGFQIPLERQRGTQERQIGSGSGFIVSSNGLVVTNRHVVSSTEAAYAGIDNKGQQYDLEIVAQDSLLDIAILQIIDSPEDLVYLEFGDSNDLQLGQTVVAIGNALGEFSNSVSVGVVSGLSRSIVAGSGFGQGELLENVIQTDAAINPGNSGGPLLNLAGQVIGVNVAIARGSENIGFALPADVVASIVASVQESGRIIRPYLGVRYVMINQELAQEMDLGVSEGALILGAGEGDAVDPNSPAGIAGLQEGDVITEISGIRVDSSRSLASVLRSIEVGSEVSLNFYRNGQSNEIELTLVEFDE